jgi:hypothetical protein
MKGSFTCHKSATWDRLLYFPSEVRHAEDIFALKNFWDVKQRLFVVTDVSEQPLGHIFEG